MDNAFTLRNALPEDVSTLALVNERAYAGRDGKILPVAVEDVEISALKERMERPSVWVYVACNRGKVIGFALGYPRIAEEKVGTILNTEYLSLLAVDPDFQGQGVAGQLLDFVASEAAGNGRGELVLWTGKADNEHARSFYEHKGFKPTGEERLSKYGPQIQYKLDL